MDPTSGQDLIDRLRGDELDSVGSEVAAGRRDHILKSLDERGRAQELVRQQYSGRYPFELLQNANDACAERDKLGRAVFVLTDQALLVADDGGGFGPDQIRAICGLARSSKDPRRTVGHKGLGFKSVGEITDQPQIICSDVAFEFDDARARAAVEAVAGVLPTTQRIPVYAFPFGAKREEFGGDAELVSSGLEKGFTTVLRLPFKPGVERGEVERHLLASLTPRLLLFLSGISMLRVSGTNGDFTARMTRTVTDGCAEVSIETDGRTTRWLVFDNRAPIDRELVEPLGDTWANVDDVTVSVGVSLDDEGRPATDRHIPLHVYFPTEEATGLPVLLHGDFAVELDRRQLAHSPEAAPFNAELTNRIATLVASDVVPYLVERFGGADGLAAISPGAPATGMGATVVERCFAALRSTSCIPSFDGSVRSPSEIFVLPSNSRPAARVHRHLDLESLGPLVAPDIDDHPAARRLLVDQLGVTSVGFGAALTHLVQPGPAASEDFYEMLVAWADSQSTRAVGVMLGKVPCVATSTGAWLAPGTDRVFFARQRTEVLLPDDLPVPVALVPEVEGLRELLSAAGVRDFNWREIVTDYVLPLLVDADTLPSMRGRAMTALRTYYATQRDGDQAVAGRIGRVLLPAADSTGATSARVRADHLYFPSAWTGSSALEVLYGPFNRPEFLAEPPPGDAAARLHDLEFYRWIGVMDRPRVQRAHSTAPSQWMTTRLQNHPHRAGAYGWDRWWTDRATIQARSCPQGHPESQRLRTSYILDRFDELAASEDPERLAFLWSELAEHWAEYEVATRAVFHCQHGNHTGERNREAPSLFLSQLTTTPWVPTAMSDTVAIVRPGEAWRLAPDTPHSIADRVPRVADSSVRSYVQLATALGVTDAARPTVSQLAHLLRQMSDETGDDEPTRATQAAARWATRMIDDVIHPTTDLEDLRDLPLLARRDGRRVFATDPVVASDPIIANVWQQHVAVLDADRDIRHLQRVLGLTSLDDPDEGVRVTPIALDETRGQPIRNVINMAKPYLAALALESVPSREDGVIRRLRDLELCICQELVLSQSFRGISDESESVTSYIQSRREAGERSRMRVVGLAYLRLGARGQPDWYRFGPDLARFLDVPTLGDTFTLVLTSDEPGRQALLSSRGVPEERLVEALDRLGIEPDEPELPDLDQLVDLERLVAQGGRPAAPAEDPSTTEQPASSSPNEKGESEADRSVASTPAAPTTPPPARRELLPIDHDAVTVLDGAPEEVAGHRSGGSGGGGLGPGGSTDPVTRAAEQHEIGRRGEEAAFEYERRRVRGFRERADEVTWVSDKHPFAPYDIRSVDLEGSPIYIEVKATVDEDPTAPFVISEAELRLALLHGERYWIYRVTQADTAVPSIHRYEDPASMLRDGRASLGLADARMRFGSTPSSDS